MLEANDSMDGVFGDGPSRRLRLPTRVKSALRDDRLVVIAGAGVSMGEPTRLPGFKSLAHTIATGTGESRNDDEPVVRFLGRLKDKGTEVHELAADVLSREDRIFFVGVSVSPHGSIACNDDIEIRPAAVCKELTDD